MIPDAVIEEIRARVDAVAVIGRHVELKRSGRTFTACCPFHGERTPSFHVYPEDKHFKCYGCGEHGDVFKFLQKLQGKEFPEVVRALAQEVGVAIPEREEDSAEQRRRREERREVLAACDAVARYFAARLWSEHGQPGSSYLRARGVAEPIAKAFRLGLASSAWDDLTPRLERKGISAAALEKAGLVARREGEGRTYDRFRGRLVFPIAAADGEVIGFGGRTLPGAPEKLAKYINTPESLLYKKSRVLYGIDLAREHIRRTRSAVLVEGYFDVIALHQAGMKNAVAVCGTALTPEHVEALQRLDCRTLTLLFDGDAAGVVAATRAAVALMPSVITGKVALLPRDGGKTDPDEFARANGAAAVEKLLADGPWLTDYLIERAAADHCGSRPAESSFEQRRAAIRHLWPLIDAVPKGTYQKSLFEERIAKHLGVDVSALSAELGTCTEMEARAGPGAAPVRTQVRAAHGSKGSKAVDALGVLAAFPALTEVAREERFLDLFTGLPLEPVARALLEQTLDGAGAVSRLEPLLPAHSLSRVKKLLAEARPEPAGAEREFRKATIEAKIEQLGDEIDRLSAEVASAGSPIPDHLRTAMLVAKSRRADLEKRRDGRRPG